MIREWRWDDLPWLLRIERQVQVFPWSEQQFRDCMAQGYQGLVGVEQENVVAYLLWLNGVDEAEILTIAVDQAYQRQGWASRLLHQLKQRALLQQKTRLLLEVAASNQAAQVLYQKQGFQQIGLRRAYYHLANKRDDAVVMAYDLLAANKVAC